MYNLRTATLFDLRVADRKPQKLCFQRRFSVKNGPSHFTRNLCACERSVQAQPASSKNVMINLQDFVTRL
jgi:hypothetical protein